MPYTPDATDVTNPIDGTVKAATAAAEFRTIKLYLRDVLLAGLAGKAASVSPTFLGTTAGQPGRTVISDDGNFVPTVTQYKWSGSAATYYGSRIALGTSGEITFANAITANIGAHTFVERMRIDSSGNVLFGSAGGSVNPGAYFEPSNSLGYGRLNFVKGSVSGTGATTAEAFYYAGAQVGRVDVTSTSVLWINSSDRRLKENIVAAADPLSLLTALQVVSYDWKVGGHVRFGLIAQDTHEVFPEMVQQGGDDANENPWGVDFIKLVPVLLAGIQKQQQQIECLQARVDMLEAR